MFHYIKHKPLFFEEQEMSRQQEVQRLLKCTFLLFYWAISTGRQPTGEEYQSPFLSFLTNWKTGPTFLIGFIFQSYWSTIARTSKKSKQNISDYMIISFSVLTLEVIMTGKQTMEKWNLTSFLVKLHQFLRIVKPDLKVITAIFFPLLRNNCQLFQQII